MEIFLYAALVLIVIQHFISRHHASKQRMRHHRAFCAHNDLLNLLFNLDMQSAVPPVQLRGYRKPGPQK